MDIQSIKQIKVKDICVSIGYWIIKVKVVQLWSEHDANNLGDVLSIEMVLMDSEGCTIQGSIPKDVLKSRLFDISKGGFYKIGRVVVIKNDGVQKETDHPNKLVFWTKSFVKRWEPQGLTSIGMINPFSAAQIRTYDNDLEHFIDIVGLCTSISSERAHLIDGKVVKMVLLELTDETGRIECVLYYQYVDLIHEFFRTNGISTPIVVVQFTRMMPFKPALFGDSVIQVVPNLTRFLFNRQMTEVFSFLERLCTNNIDLSPRLNHVTKGPVEVELVDQFVLSYPKKTIYEFCFSGKVGIYVVIGTIINVFGNEQWLDLLSYCQVYANNLCPFCFTSSPYKLLPRYNVKAEVFDGVESTNVLLHDYHVLDALNYLTTKPSRNEDSIMFSSNNT